MAELRSILNKIRPLRCLVGSRKHAVAWLPGAASTAFAARFGQVAIETQPIILLAVDEAIDRFGVNPNDTEAVRP